MTCMENQKMIMPFMNKNIDSEELDKFLAHTKTCSECMEELEVYYTLITSMKQLDENHELSNDYRQDLIELLEKTEEQIDGRKLRQRVKRLSLMIIIGIIAVASTFRIGEIVVEDVIHKATVSNYMPEKISLLNSKDFPSEIEEQLPSIFMYLRQTNKDGSASMQGYYGDRIWDNMIIQKEFGQATKLPEWTVLNY